MIPSKRKILIESKINKGIFRRLGVKEITCQCRRLIPSLGRSPGEGEGNPLQYSCLEITWTEEPWGHKELDTTDHTCTKYIKHFKISDTLNMNVHINKSQLKLYKELVSKLGFFASSVVKNLPANARDTGLVPGLGRSPKGRHATHFRILA